LTVIDWVAGLRKQADGADELRMRRGNRIGTSSRSAWGRRIPWRSESGQSLVLIVLSLTLMFGIAALVFDQAELAVAHHHAQIAADAGALAAAEDMSTTNTPPSTVTTDGTSAASDNYKNSTVTISEPSGTQAQAQVTGSVNLPFGNMFGFSSGSVTAHAVAQVNTTVTNVDGTILSVGCGNSWSTNCTYNAGNVIPTGASTSDDGWQVTNAAEDPTTGYANGQTTVNLQTCQGSQGNGNCYDPGATVPETSDAEVVDLNGQSEGGMWQTVSTVPSARYVLTFWLTGNPALNGWPAASTNSFPIDAYITDGANNPYTPTVAESSPATSPCASYQPTTGYITCGWWNYQDQVCGASGVNLQDCMSGQEQANFTQESISFIAQSTSTTITFNSEVNDGDQMDGSLGWYYCGPELANITFGSPEIQLAQ
jgi:hypothetical protein